MPTTRPGNNRSIAIVSRHWGVRFLFTLLFTAAFVFQPNLASTASSSPAELEQTAARLEAEWTSESVRRAVELNFSASEAFSRTGNYSQAARTLRRAARLQTIVGETEPALRTLKQASLLNAKLPPLEAIKTLTLYSRMLLLTDATYEGELQVEKARRLSEVSTDPTAQGLVLRATAEVKERRGDFAAAEADYLKAVGVFRPGDDENRLARTLLLLAGTQISLGKYSQGLENVDEARTVFITHGRVRDAVLSTITRGHLLGLLGRKQEAIDQYLEAEARFPSDIDHGERAGLLAGLGYAYQDLGELRLALVKRRQALELFDFERDWVAAAYALAPLIDISFKLGDESGAFEYLKRSEELAKRTGHDLALAVSHGLIGDNYFSKGDDSRAAEYYQKAIPIAERAKHRYTISTINDKLGAIALRAGKNKQARRHFNIALELSRQMRNALLETNTLFNLAKLELAEARTFEALKLSQGVIDQTERLSSSVRNSRLRSSHFASVSERYELHIHLLMRAAEESGDQRYARQALQAAERSRARTMVESLALTDANLIADATPEMAKKDRELRSSLRAASDRLTDLLSSGGSPEAIKRGDEEVALLQHDIEELRAELKRTSPAYSAIKDPPPLDIEGFQKNALDERSVLLEFSVGENGSYVWVTDKTSVSSFELPPRSELNSRLLRFSNILRSRETRHGESIEEYQQRTAEASENYQSENLALSDLLLGNFAEKIRGKRLIVVADGPLHYLPFSTLFFPGSDRPLIDSNEVVYQPSAQTLSLVQNTRKARDQTERQDLVIFSDPVFTKEDERLTPLASPAAPGEARSVGSLASLTRLPGSGREADSIVSAIGESSTRLFSGFAATREQFLNARLGEYKILHLATHAVADSERPETTGVVLSGFGEDGSQHDQLVRLQDIYGLNLSADLVVLSACETAAGKELRGEGLLSLNNAFIQAGSRSVVSTLWRVDDEASQFFMSRFYESLSDGLTASESLKQAQQALRMEPRFSSPFYWAAFTLHGDPNVRLQRSSSYFTYGLSATVVSFLVLGIVGWKCRSRILRRNC